MEVGSSVSGGGAKATGGRTKTPGIPTSTRLQRNQAEKERRDKLNGFISELATLVPMVSNATKPLDKVSILRLAAAEMRLHFSCLNPKRYKNKPLALPPAIMASLDLIEKTIGGFVIVTTLTGLIVFCSKSIEDYLGYQNIDVMGNKVVKYIYDDDVRYFETKVNSVVKNLKKGSKKKTKVIKAHMLQKPLPRSNESSRPRKMIFKLSVHQNDLSEINGGVSSSQTAPKKTRPSKDFGYSAVVLMFVEPVRLEPEIDITYIDSNQDVYFTRHGLQGEIIYADQRISTITGYMRHDVQGTSAYQYICPSDVPIALFAQRAMFTSSDGKGDIVYRLRIRDMRYIYLQSSGQIAYKESSSEISHFVCFNRLLSEEEGSHELKKFQQRYAPQIMAAKMLQSKQNPGNQSPNTEMAYEQALAIMSSSNLPDVEEASGSQMNSFECSKVSSPEIVTSACDQVLLSDSYTSASNSSIAPNSVHSTEGHHSITSPISKCRSNSIASDYSGYSSEQMDCILENQEQKDSLRTDISPFLANTYVSPMNVEETSSRQEQLVNEIMKLENPLAIKKSRRVQNVVNCNGSYVIQSDTFVNMKSLHSVNASSNLQGSSEEPLKELTMDLNLEPRELQKSFLNSGVPLNSPTNICADQSNGFMPAVNGYNVEYANYNGHIRNETPQFVSLQKNIKFPIVNATAPILHNNERVDFTEHQKVLGKRYPNSPNLRMYEGTSDLSLLQSSNYPLAEVSDVDEAIEYTSFNNSYLPKDVSNYANGADATTYNDLDVLGSKTFSSNPYEIDVTMPVSSADFHSSYPPVSSFDIMDTSTEALEVNLIPRKIMERKIVISNSDFSGAPSVKRSFADRNGSSDVYSDAFTPNALLGNRSSDSCEPIPSLDMSMNKELYEELNMFFQKLPQTNARQNSNFAEQVSEFPVNSNSSLQGSISSSDAKRPPSSSSSSLAKKHYHC